MDDGEMLRVAGEGDQSSENGPNGDLYLQLNIAEDPFFVRHQNDVGCFVPVTYTQAVLGAEVEVPTLEARRH